jgi:NAD(P)-dependent dehydrogenase (short-subunit alcohol dehydrogenase family)
VLSRPVAAARRLGRMDDTKIALVTGANKGIGFEIVRLLMAEGMTVLLGSRDPDRGAAAARETGARPVTLDVTDADSIAAVADLVKAEYGRLDVLVNNAGILAGWGPPSALSVDDFRNVFETNVYGVIAVTNALLPLLKESAAARIINVSSGMGSLAELTEQGNVPILAYTASKTALNALTVGYALELAGTAITVNSADPGYCATDLNGHTGPRKPSEGAVIAAQLATAPAGGPNGEFHNDAGVVPW